MNATPGTAILFPGQGSQRKGMREVVGRTRPDLLAMAAAELGADPFERLDEGTAFQQPAIYCASIAGWTEAGKPVGNFMAGHSLGELAAVAAAGAISVEDGLRLAVARGRIMQAAAERAPGAMMAVLGTWDGAHELAASLGVTVANDNAPGQLVLSGPKEAIAEARKRLKAEGLKAIKLPVAGAFHSPAMAEAVPEFKRVLASVEFSPPSVALISSTTARPFRDIRAGLASAFTEPVRWRETLLFLYGLGVRRFVESGPGDVLTGLVRRTLPGADAGPADPIDPAPPEVKSGV